MKKNALASLALAFATAFALADNLGTATKVGSLSRSTDYVYTADQADTVIATRVPTTRTVNGHALTGNITLTPADIGVDTNVVHLTGDESISGKKTFSLGNGGGSFVIATGNSTTGDVALQGMGGGRVSLHPGYIRLKRDSIGGGQDAYISSDAVQHDRLTDGSGVWYIKRTDAATTAPLMDGTASVGVYTNYARADHVHPTDTSRAAASALSAHTNNATIHITASERTSWSGAASTASTAVQSVKISGSATELKSGTTATIPLASTSASGVVQLSSATNSTSEAIAATPKAVKAALEAANAYADAKAASVAYTHPSYTARTGKPTANASPGFGGAFTVSQITSDGSGHVTGATDRTITIPNAAATTSAAGLMSAADKTALDSLAAGAVTKASIAAALQAQGITSADDMDDMDTLAAKVAAIIAVLEALD